MVWFPFLPGARLPVILENNMQQNFHQNHNPKKEVAVEKRKAFSNSLEEIFIHQQKGRIFSATNSSSGLIFVKIRAESGRIFNKNPGKIRAKIRAKLIFCDYVVFFFI